MTKLEKPNEGEMFLAFRDGSESALAFFLRLYHTSLCIFAHRKVITQSIAEDIVEEAFIKAWDKRRDFESLPMMKSFLYVATKNACLNYLKKYKKDTFHYRQFTYLNHHSNDHLEVVRAEVLAAVYDAIEELPGKCQHVFKMSFLDGKKNQQIADALSISLQTVKNQKVRAIKYLQQRFKGKEHLLHAAIPGAVFFF